MRTRLLLVAVLGASAVLAALLLRPAQAAAPTVELAAVTMNAPKVIEIHKADDAGKPGAQRGALGQQRFAQKAHQSSPSPDRLEFRFDHPAKITGVWLSIDSTEWQEWAVGINAPSYGTVARDWLMHISVSSAPRDEHATFGQGFEIGPDDYLSVVAWLWNQSDADWWISPEVIVYYEWL